MANKPVAMRTHWINLTNRRIRNATTFSHFRQFIQIISTDHFAATLSSSQMASKWSENLNTVNKSKISKYKPDLVNKFYDQNIYAIINFRQKSSSQ